MSEENVAVAIAQFERTNARDFEGVLETWAEEVELVLHGELGALGNPPPGKTAVGEWFADWFRQFGRDYRFDVEEVHAAGGRVLLVASHHGHGRRSGVTVEQRTAYLYTFRDARVVRIEVWAEEDREAAFEAAGLRARE